MTPHDLAVLFFKKGLEDQLIAEKLAVAPEVPDSGVGFHAQQAIEKFLKAVLALNEVRVRKTHDISALTSQINELGISSPEGLDDAVELTSYSVLARYPMSSDPEPLDRDAALELVSKVRVFAEEQVTPRN